MAGLVRAQRRDADTKAPSSASRKPPRLAKPERTTGGDRRILILAAAGDLFSHRGFPNVSIDDIGRKAGVTGPAVYRHFATKSLILEALFDEMIACLDLKLSEHVTNVDEPKLDELIAAFVSFALATGTRVRLWDQEGRYLDRAAVTRIKASQLSYVTNVAAAIERQFGVAQPDGAWLVKGLVGLIHSMASLSKRDSPAMELQLRSAALGAISSFATAYRGL